MTLALSINLKSITPIVGACGPTNIPRTIRNGITENLTFQQLLPQLQLILTLYQLQN